MDKAIHLELRYPNLAKTNYTVTSPKSQEYNYTQENIPNT